MPTLAAATLAVPKPAAPRPSSKPVTRRRKQMAREVVLEIEALRVSLRHAVEQYEVRLAGQMLALMRALDEDEGTPPSRVSGAMLRSIRGTELKPRKGRAKDLVRLQDLVAHLTELLPAPPEG
jgi:hypothetical protein